MTEDEALVERAKSHERFIEDIDYKNDIDRIVSEGVAKLEKTFDWSMYKLEERLKPIESGYLALQAYLSFPNDKLKAYRAVDYMVDSDTYYGEKYIIAVKARIKLKGWYETLEED